MSPAPVIEIDRAVIIFEQMGVDRLGAVNETVNQRLAEITPVWAFRGIRNGNLQSAGFPVLLDIVGGKHKVMPALVLNLGRRPHRSPDPGKILHPNNAVVFVPMDQVHRTESIQIHLLRIFRIRPGGINPVPALIGSCLRVRIPAGYNRVRYPFQQTLFFQWTSSFILLIPLRLCPPESSAGRPETQ
ncbi:hypothetical protein D3C75_970010 [compost metagenome]